MIFTLNYIELINRWWSSDKDSPIKITKDQDGHSSDQVEVPAPSEGSGQGEPEVVSSQGGGGGGWLVPAGRALPRGPQQAGAGRVAGAVGRGPHRQVQSGVPSNTSQQTLVMNHKQDCLLRHWNINTYKLYTLSSKISLFFFRSDLEKKTYSEKILDELLDNER